MRIIFVLMIAGCLLSCSGGTAVDKKLSGCDSLVITFNMPNSDSVTNRVSTTESNAINKLSHFLSGKDVQTDNCAFNGNLAFFKAGEPLLLVGFGYADDKCSYFKYELDSKTVNAGMSSEAVDFLKSLEAGKDWY